MAEFSRIRVTPPEEEDIVIQAGAVKEPAPSASAAPSSSETQEPEGTAVPVEGPRTTSQARRASYEETTLEDLQRTRMSGMQKAIVVLAIVAVVAFVIWYVLLH